ncbi:vesicle transport protein USE1-like [Ptychodera flava]|uniref:vesicle transport protein USE1-like n=1 Tax=Ptychodera flava TaxID=63121 RepID=UPI00396A6D7B
MASRMETNLQRLLARCEAMAAEGRQGDWRLEKYIGALQEKLGELKKSPSKPSQEALQEYSRKIEFLRGLIEAQKLSSATDKAMATQRLVPGKTSTLPDTKTSSTTKGIHLQATSRYTNEMREELLGQENSQENGLRHRKKTEESGEDLDTLLQHHQDMQEKLAEDMIKLAQSLKHNSIVASNIIKEDNKMLGDATKLADVNYDRLKVESDRLEAHTKKSCNWWVWILLLVVCITFLWMIMFIRMFPKKT